MLVKPIATRLEPGAASHRSVSACRDMWGIRPVLCVSATRTVPEARVRMCVPIPPIRSLDPRRPISAAAQAVPRNSMAARATMGRSKSLMAHKPLPVGDAIRVSGGCTVSSAARTSALLGHFAQQQALPRSCARSISCAPSTRRPPHPALSIPYPPPGRQHARASTGTPMRA